jgi:XTP/dITP diphosphohydrolase
METLIFATNNSHKLQEIKQILRNKFNIKSLNDIGFEGDIPETHPTLQGNSLQKAQYIYDRYQTPCFADDTGLVIDALDGEPGVYSARYAGKNASFEDNMNKVLEKLGNHKNRAARFITVITYIDTNGTPHFFEGMVNGFILSEKRGVKGFGYDPIFQPAGYNKTFAEMNDDEKNAISHRGRATEKFVIFLLNQ